MKVSFSWLVLCFVRDLAALKVVYNISQRPCYLVCLFVMMKIELKKYELIIAVIDTICGRYIIMSFSHHSGCLTVIVAVQQMVVSLSSLTQCLNGKQLECDTMEQSDNNIRTLIMMYISSAGFKIVDMSK